LIPGRCSILNLFVFVFAEEEVVGANARAEPASASVHAAVVTEGFVANRTPPELLFLVTDLACNTVQSPVLLWLLGRTKKSTLLVS
jgi:hypothetical protein